jgi:beta-xylosidase
VSVSTSKARRRLGLVVAIATTALIAGACIPPPPEGPVGGATADPVSVDIGHGRIKTLDFPDPFIMKTGDGHYGYSTDEENASAQVVMYYAYSTGAGDSTAQVISSPDLVNWSWVGDAFVGPAPYVAGVEGNGWAQLWGHTWAPGVIERPANPPDKRFVMYYSALSRVWPSAGMHCIGRAYSATPVGPFYDEQTQPLLCQPDRGGSIDPFPLEVDGQVYLVSQSYGSPTETTRLWTTRLTPDGLSLAGAPGELISQLWDSWEVAVVENPSMMPAPGGGFLLFYSTDRWWSTDYKNGVAKCDTLFGPCRRVYSTPVLATRGAMAGPGGGATVQGPDGNWVFAFHAWTAPFVGYAGDDRYARTMRLLPITFPYGNGNPKIG